MRARLRIGLGLVSGLASLGVAAAVAAPPQISAGISSAPNSTPVPFDADAFLFGEATFARLDMQSAAPALLQALAHAPDDHALARKALAAGVMAGDLPTTPPVTPDRLAALAATLPGDALAQIVLGNRAALAGNWAEARRAYSRVSGSGFDGVRGLLVAAAQWGGGDADGALATLDAAHGGGANGIYALFAAEIAAASGHVAQAESLRSAALSGLPDGNIVLVSMAAELAARRGELAAARQLIHALVGGRPGMALAEPQLDAALRDAPPLTPRKLIAHAYTAAGFAVGAMLAQTLDQNGGDPGSDAGPLPPAAIRDVSRLAFRDELLRLRLALSLDPDDAPARLAVAEVLASSGQSRAALLDLAHVDAHAPMAAAAQWSAADIETDLGETDRARAIAQQLAQAFPARAEPQQLFGDIALHDKNFVDAAKHYQQALDLQAAARRKPSATFGDTSKPEDARDDWPLLASLGGALDLAGEWAKAHVVLERALALSPDRPLLLNYLGYGDLMHDPTDPHAVAAARARLEKALSITPDDPNIRDSLGYALLLQQDPHRALDLFEAAAEKMPEDPVINGHLGDAYFALGRRIEAVEQWEWALLCGPDADLAAELRHKLHDAGAPDPLPAKAADATRTGPVAGRR